jgi:hypothetical protein
VCFTIHFSMSRFARGTNGSESQMSEKTASGSAGVPPACMNNSRDFVS